jgi:hypothetical protein
MRQLTARVTAISSSSLITVASLRHFHSAPLIQCRSLPASALDNLSAKASEPDRCCLGNLQLTSRPIVLPVAARYFSGFCKAGPFSNSVMCKDSRAKSAERWRTHDSWRSPSDNLGIGAESDCCMTEAISLLLTGIVTLAPAGREYPSVFGTQCPSVHGCCCYWL